MEHGETQGIPQEPTPEEGNPPRAERDPRRPTATAPPSVEQSVYEDAEHVGKDGPDAADPASAAGKPEPSDEPALESDDDLNADEDANLRITRETAHETKEARDEEH